MATILYSKTLGKTNNLIVDSDPSAGGGVVAPAGSTANIIDTGSIYIKNSTTATDWSLIQTSFNLNDPNALYKDGSRQLTGDWTVGAFNFLDTGGGVSLKVESRQLFLADATAVLEWGDMLLRNSAGNRSVDWDLSYLYDTNAIVRINWAIGMTNDSVGANSIDSENRLLIDGSSNTSIEWGTTRILRDISTQQSVDWDFRQLFDTAGVEAINYADRKGYTSADKLSINWESEILVDNDRIVLDWKNQFLHQDWGCDSNFSIGGLISSYRGVSTVSGGVPSILASSVQTGKTAAITATTIYVVPASKNGMYKVSFVASITTAASTSSVLGGTNGFQIKYTDQNDSVVKTSPAGLQVSSVNTTATTISGVFIANCKASTNLQYLMDYTSVGVTGMAFNINIKVEAIG